MKALAIKLQINWMTVWDELSSEIINESFKACGITTSDPALIHCMDDGQLIEYTATIFRERREEEKKRTSVIQSQRKTVMMMTKCSCRS